MQSTKIGIAPSLRIGNKQDAIVKLGSITSSPGLIFEMLKARSRAVDPLLTAMACLIPKCKANLFSNSRTTEVSPETKPSCKTLVTELMSSSEILNVLRENLFS